VKVFAGQANLIQLGLQQGGPAGFGLRRHACFDFNLDKKRGFEARRA